jgi:hypothetical protein
MRLAQQLQDPQATVEGMAGTAFGLARIAGGAMGLNGSDMDAILATGVPRWAIAVVAFAAGALVTARWAPEPWIGHVRMYGRR